MCGRVSRGGFPFMHMSSTSRAARWLIVLPAIAFLAPLARAEVTGPAGGGAPHSTIQPSLGMNYLVRTEGIYQRLGEVTMFGGNFAPAGFQFALGQSLPILD